MRAPIWIYTCYNTALYIAVTMIPPVRRQVVAGIRTMPPAKLAWFTDLVIAPDTAAWTPPWLIRAVHQACIDRRVRSSAAKLTQRWPEVLL